MKEEEAYHRLQEVIRGSVPVQGELARVKSVNKDEMECTVTLISNEDLEIEEVNLKAVIDGTQNGFIRIPKADSVVLISPIENTDGDHYVVMYSDIDEILFVQNDKEILNIDDEGNILFLNDAEAGSALRVESSGNVIFHEGENNGLIIIQNLVDKLNNIENKLNDLINDYTTHNHAHPQGPTTAFFPPPPPIISALVETQVADLENDKVKH